MPGLILIVIYHIILLSINHFLQPTTVLVTSIIIICASIISLVYTTDRIKPIRTLMIIGDSVIYRYAWIALFTWFSYHQLRNTTYLSFATPDNLSILSTGQRTAIIVGVMFWLIGTIVLWRIDIQKNIRPLSRSAASLSAFAIISYIVHIPWQGSAGLQSTDHDIIPHNQTVIGQSQSPDVMVVFLESISAADSIHYRSGATLIPKFDAIAAEGMVMTQMIANGCTSDASHLSLLFGDLPYDYVSGRGFYGQSRAQDTGLASYFNAVGYDTQFVSTVPLTFLDQRSFVSQAGFDQIIGEEAFLDAPQYGFDSAPDEYLYDRMISQRKNNDLQPQLIVGQTIATHKPYHTPYGVTRDSAYGYADQQLGDFYNTLKEEGFFDDGILILVSDHRSFDPMTSRERKTRGQSAYGRIATAIIGTNIASGSRYDGPLQHTDIYYTLRELISTNTYTTPIYNNPLTNTTSKPRSTRFCNFIENRHHITRDDEQFFLQQTEHPSLLNRFGVMSDSAITLPTNTITDDAISLEPASRYDTQKARIVAHRGGVTNGENSLITTLQAADMGIHHIELDVALTSDNKILLTNGDLNNLQCQGLIGNTRFHTAASLMDRCTTVHGDDLTDISQLLAKINSRFEMVQLEIKLPDHIGMARIQPMVDTIATIIQDLSMTDQVVLISYNDAVRDYAQSLGTIQVGYDTFDPSLFARLSPDSYHHLLTEHSQWTYNQIQAADLSNQSFSIYTVVSTADILRGFISPANYILVRNIPRALALLDLYNPNRISVHNIPPIP